MKRIKEIPFFAQLDDSDIEKLEAISTLKSFDKGDILFYEGDKPEYLHVLLDGVLKLYKTNFKGTQIFLHQFLPVSFVAELANFENIPYPATAEFTVKGAVLKIDYERFKEDFMRHPDLSFKIIKSLTGKLKIMSEVVHKEVILTSEAKVAKFIVENGALFGSLKNTQIAPLLNLTPETLSRTLTKMKQQELIVLDENNVLLSCEEETLRSMYE